MKCFVGLILMMQLMTARCQFAQSPCPEIFDYVYEGPNLYGSIKLQPSGPVSSLLIRVNFTIATRLQTTYYGKVEPVGPDSQYLQRYNRGAPLTYRVHFPVTSPTPRLTALSVNGQLICYGPGDVVEPNQYVSSISLQHTLFLAPGSSFITFNNDGISRPMPVRDNRFEYFDLTDDGEFQFNIPNRNTNQNPGDNINWNVNEIKPIFTNIPQKKPIQFNTPVPHTQKKQPQRHKVNSQSQTSTMAPIVTPLPQTNKPEGSRESESSGGSVSDFCGVVAGGNEQVPLIYHGQSYTRGELPWLVAIYRRRDGSLTFICSGTLVSDRHVVTAAHCIHQKSSYTSIRDIVVKVGVYNLEDWGDDITVTRVLAKVTIHESYNSSVLSNDISVFTFEKTVTFNNFIRPACLWDGNNDLSRIVGASGVVAGWGKSEFGEGGRGEPRLVRIPVVSTAACRASKPDFHKLTSSKTLCAGNRDGVGPCLGDSGGGLYLLEGGRWRLRGVVSLSLRPPNNDNSCNLNEYIVFTDAAQYLGWVRNIMRQQ